MRRFKSYLHRRGIRDSEGCAKWAADNGISSLADITSFCSSREIEIRDEPAFKIMFSFLFKNDSGQITTETEAENDLPPSSTSNLTAWHVPAAERPLSKSAAVPKPKRKRRTRKAAASKDKK